MDPPPIHIQIQPPAQRQRRGKNKGAFTKVSSSSSRTTNNYRIRKLADGRLGQQHVSQVLPAVAQPQEEQELTNPGPLDDPQPLPDGARAAAPAKKQRARSSNTWAVGRSYLSAVARTLTFGFHSRSASRNSFPFVTFTYMNSYAMTVSEMQQITSNAHRARSPLEPIVVPHVFIHQSYAVPACFRSTKGCPCIL